MIEAHKHAANSESLIVGTGHAGDGNIHLVIFQPDRAKREALINAFFDLGKAMGGEVSAEHGIGTEKKAYYTARENPAKLALMRRIKLAFDPNGIMNPGKVFDLPR